MLDTEVLKKTMSDAVIQKLNVMVNEIKESLVSPTYEKIIKDFHIGVEDSMLRFSIDLLSGFETGNQDVLRVLTYGGVFEKRNKKKEKKFVQVPPNPVLLRYFS